MIPSVASSRANGCALPRTELLFLGLISGTSVDAIDAALLDFSQPAPRMVAARAFPFDPDLQAELLRIIEAPSAEIECLGHLDVGVGRAFAQAALDLLRQHGIAPERIAAIGSHGQTIRHAPRGAAPFSWQIGDPNVITEMTGISTVADFRRRDVAAGGEGAPLVPAFHEHVFRSASEERVIVNIGGIANITVLRAGAPLLGFDTGPGNRLMDAWIRESRGEPHDEGGRWASSGALDVALLGRLSSEPYLQLEPPKSTGRELFNLSWLRAQLSGREPAADVQRTLLELTARSVVAACAAHAPGAALYVCGGGALNAALMSRLAELAAPTPVRSTADLGVDPMFVEAAAFAWFASRTLSGETSSLASVTGARGARILGGVYRA